MARNKYRELLPGYKRRKYLRLLKVAGGILLLILLVAAFPIALISYSSIRNYYLRTEGVIAKAVVIDDRNYLGHIHGRFTYSYQFVVNNKKYTGNSLDSKYRVGDAVKIKYAPTYPQFNEIVR